MKVKVLCRNPDDYLRETKTDIHKIQRNYDPALHPFEVPREYTRALNAVKLERIFAKPFIGSLDGHGDGIQCMHKHPTSLSLLLSGACDGQVKLWDLTHRRCVWTVQAHSGIVRGICASKKGDYFYTVGDDKSIKQWSLTSNQDEDIGEPTNTVLVKSPLLGVTHHQTESLLATCGEKVELWEGTRSESLRSFSWGVDTVQTISFNPVETNLLGSSASDRSIMFYDIREAYPLRKVVLEMRSNSLCWNPMEAFVFTVANEDHNLYTFDMRHLKRPLHVHMDHVAAVLSVDYSPTGKEFVSGSYDKTIRIFHYRQGHSRELYHTKRMQRLSCVLWSLDNRYLLSGSDEMNIRMWKATAWEKLGKSSTREEATFQYNAKLKERFQHHPEIKRIIKHRHVPKHVYNGRVEKRAMLQSRKKKEANRRKHSKPGTVPYVSERSKHIVREDE